jgi:transposase
LETSDQEETPLPALKAQALQEKIRTLKERLELYRDLLQQLDQTGETQVSLTDPDSRLMHSNGHSEVCYNVQTVVDNKHKMLVDFEVTSDANDRCQLAKMAQAAQETLGTESLDVVADKGYATPDELKACEMRGLAPYVPIPAPTERRKNGVPTAEFYHAKFQYSAERDIYLCPQGQTLTPIFKTRRKEHSVTTYATKACVECPVRAECTIHKRGRRIYRSDQEGVMERLRQRLAAHPEKLDQRKSLSEHPFGTLKYTWDQGYFLTRRLLHVSAEFSLSGLAYNVKRAISILGVPTLVHALT